MRMGWGWWIVGTSEEVGYEASSNFSKLLLTMIGISFGIWCCCLLTRWAKFFFWIGGGIIMITYWHYERAFWGSRAWVLRRHWIPGRKMSGLAGSFKKRRLVYKEEILIDTRSGSSPYKQAVEKVFLPCCYSGTVPHLDNLNKKPK